MAESIVQRKLRSEGGEIPLRRHRFVSAAAAVAIFRAAPAIDAGRFRAEVDAWADQDTLPRA